MDDAKLMELAEQVDIELVGIPQPPSELGMKWIAKFAALVAADTKERCVRKIDEIDDGEQPAYRHCQEAIRALD